MGNRQIGAIHRQWLCITQELNRRFSAAIEKHISCGDGFKPKVFHNGSSNDLFADEISGIPAADDRHEKDSIKIRTQLVYGTREQNHRHLGYFLNAGNTLMKLAVHEKAASRKDGVHLRLVDRMDKSVQYAVVLPIGIDENQIAGALLVPHVHQMFKHGTHCSNLLRNETRVSIASLECFSVIATLRNRGSSSSIVPG